MIKAVKFSYVGGPRQGSEVIVDDEKNIDARISFLCHRGIRNYEHTEPVDVALESIKLVELTALDLVNIVKLGVQEQYDEQFKRFTDKFDKDSAVQQFQIDHSSDTIESIDKDEDADFPIFAADIGWTVMSKEDRSYIGDITEINVEERTITYKRRSDDEFITESMEDMKGRTLPF